jgi:two-component system, NarL family, sensor histidine kinase UhpB
MPKALNPLVSRLTHELPKHDVAAVIGITVLSVALSAHFQLTEALYALTRRWEYFQLDELQIGMLVLTLGLIWLSWRRYRQAGRELHARELAEARLAGVLADNRKLAQEHLRIQELERKHLARELHDELGQYLNAIKLDAVSICESDGRDARFSTQASQSIIRSIDHVHAAVSDMIRRLRPVGLDELGLLAAIEHCVDHWRQRLPDTRFCLSLRGDFEALEEPLTLTLYRLIQEGLTNIYKHASARQVHIVLERRASVAPGVTDELLLSVADDGRGMKSDAQTPGFGLRGMRERVELAGGTFLLRSVPGGGLSFEARLAAKGEK